jgi:uncharacterized coiled-coil protein SlyX
MEVLHMASKPKVPQTETEVKAAVESNLAALKKQVAEQATRIAELESALAAKAVGRSKVALPELKNQIDKLIKTVAEHPTDYYSMLELKRLKANYSSIISKRKATANSK